MNNDNPQNYYLPPINRPYSVLPIQGLNVNYVPMNQPEIVLTYSTPMPQPPMQQQPMPDLLMQQPVLHLPQIQNQPRPELLMQLPPMQQPPMQLTQLQRLPQLQQPPMQQTPMHQLIIQPNPTQNMLMQVAPMQHPPLQQPQMHSFTITPVNCPNTVQQPICRPTYWSYEECQAMGIYPDLNECIMRLRRKVSELMYTLNANQPNVYQYLNASGLNNILDSYDAMKYYLWENLGAEAAGDVFEQLGLRRPIFITQQDVDSLITKPRARKRRYQN